ncbi:acyloxyacyl hydrolase [Caerostris darwini]|uniref:Acyloxyacyl hydrolase n=1 Tax=Caerostris darwini TaxID=1538125 RepID=A0AAV4UWJ3_9ARAC|nr:acyloxyacyl hydrolase [Caerostris darwini]
MFSFLGDGKMFAMSSGQSPSEFLEGYKISKKLFRSSHDPKEIDVNGGRACAACTVLVGLVEQVAEVNNRTVTNMVSELCVYLPSEYSILCDILVHLWGPAIIEKLSNKESADVVCYSLGICHVDEGMEYCHLFPEPEGGMENAVRISRSGSTVLPFFHWSLVERLSSACELPGVSMVCRTINSILSKMKPFIDLDGDHYSIIETFRGDAWRGRDCDDVNDMIYPGRMPMNSDILTDSNCNGIYGMNEASGSPYEDELCKDTKSQGLIYIGDSIGAHFHVPREWLTARELTMDILKNFSFVVGNELDWPQTSFPTGYQNLSWPIIEGQTDSIYWRIRKRNLCNHRDFQNICFNGATSGSMLSYLNSIARKPQIDKPAIVMYGMMGNDVCSRWMKSLDDLTTPEQFRSNVISTLDNLNGILPKGSHVLLVGLVNGSFIYNAMGERLHPIGQLHGDVHYKDMYEWFNCMRIGPCYGWMNKNETIREATTQRAVELSNVLKDIAANEKYDSFSIHFLSNPLATVIRQWEKDGYPLWKLIEPVDSLHPVQAILPLITAAIWDEIETNFPEVLGEVNPNNAAIQKLFGDQGGH